MYLAMQESRAMITDLQPPRICLNMWKYSIFYNHEYNTSDKYSFLLNRFISTMIHFAHLIISFNRFRTKTLPYQ